MKATPRRLSALMAGLALMVCVSGPAYAEGYTIKADVKLRSGPGMHAAVIGVLEHNQTIQFTGKTNAWLKVTTLTGMKGYVRDDMVSDVWIKAHKQERRLYLVKAGTVIKTYRMALSTQKPVGDKVKQGDCATPEGRFYLCEMLRDPGQAKYGARSMRLSYPNIEDARRGLQQRLIDYNTYLSIVRQIKAAAMPLQDTRLGGSIRIHGGGAASDWTLGCMALENRDVVELFEQVREGTRVEVYASAQADQEINRANDLNQKILEGAKKQLRNPSLYTQAAAAVIRLNYPNGDIAPKQAVCTDIIIRALRSAGLDLQALLHEDLQTHPATYQGHIATPDYHIDHRRTRNLQIYFQKHALSLAQSIGPDNLRQWQAGDLVTFDTGIANGTVYDHIGIVNDAFTNQGFPTVINIWTIGYRTAAMDLLGVNYPKVVGHFRMTHPFDYE